MSEHQSHDGDRPPILDFDPARIAVINPNDHATPIDGAAGCVLTFFHEEANRLIETAGLPVIATVKSEMGAHHAHGIEHEGRTIGLFKLGVGAPLAAGMLEELIACGFRTFICCGSAGVLDREIQYGHLIVPTRAIRHEGTSYHYLPADQTVGPDPDAVKALTCLLDERKVPYLTGPTWTTDAFYRETHGLVRRRREQGCLTVEMEASAIFAVSEFRGAKTAMLLYGGDDVSQETWDRRRWKMPGATAPMGEEADVDTRTRLIELAIEAVGRLC